MNEPSNLWGTTVRTDLLRQQRDAFVRDLPDLNNLPQVAPAPEGANG